jgi:hypothetical protein
LLDTLSSSLFEPANALFDVLSLILRRSPVRFGLRSKEQAKIKEFAGRKN